VRREVKGEDVTDEPLPQRKARFQAEAYNEVKAEAAGRALSLAEVEHVLQLARDMGASDDAQLEVRTTLWKLAPKEIVIRVVK
jgi:hypothetical protein